MKNPTHSVNGMVKNILKNSQVIEVKEHLYRIENHDGRKSCQTLRCCSKITMDSIEVPTHQLKNAGIVKSDRYVAIQVITFDRGQVLSCIAKPELRMAKELREMLERDKSFEDYLERVSEARSRRTEARDKIFRRMEKSISEKTQEFLDQNK